MNTIKFNDTVFQVESYNKNTYFEGESVNSNGTCNIITSDATALNALAEDEITSIQIYHDEELIYDSQNIKCSITSINEYLNGDHMNIQISLIFDLT